MYPVCICTYFGTRTYPIDIHTYLRIQCRSYIEMYRNSLFILLANIMSCSWVYFVYLLGGDHWLPSLALAHCGLCAIVQYNSVAIVVVVDFCIFLLFCFCSSWSCTFISLTLPLALLLNIVTLYFVIAFAYVRTRACQAWGVATSIFAPPFRIVRTPTTVIYHHLVRDGTSAALAFFSL